MDKVAAYRVALASSELWDHESLIKVSSMGLRAASLRGALPSPVRKLLPGGPSPQELARRFTPDEISAGMSDDLGDTFFSPVPKTRTLVSPNKTQVTPQSALPGGMPKQVPSRTAGRELAKQIAAFRRRVAEVNAMPEGPSRAKAMAENVDRQRKLSLDLSDVRGRFSGPNAIVEPDEGDVTRFISRLRAERPSVPYDRYTPINL